MRIVVLIPLWAACVIAHAENSTCTTKDFRGVYAFHAQASNVVTNALITFAGSLTADGEGKITAWKDAAAIAATPIVPPIFKLVTPFLDRYQEAKGLGADILYTVEPDCRITITAVFLGPTGNPSPLVWLGAITFGGDEALVMNGSTQSPYVSLVTLKRAARNREVTQK